jgi:hypothetical protein
MKELLCFRNLIKIESNTEKINKIKYIFLKYQIAD